MATGEPWTADELATLVRLCGEGLSPKDIAARLPGRSRLAVIGEAFRKNIKLADNRPMRVKRVGNKPVRSRPRREPSERTAPKFRASKQPRPLTFSSDPASLVAAAYFAASDAAQRRRDGFREARRL